MCEWGLNNYVIWIANSVKNWEGGGGKGGRKEDDEREMR
jgi:hypothetical protein